MYVGADSIKWAEQVKKRGHRVGRKLWESFWEELEVESEDRYDQSTLYTYMEFPKTK